MVKCPNCCGVLEQKNGSRKFSAQIGNPEIAIVETKDPHFCNGCNQYFLSTKEMISTILQIQKLGKNVQKISAGVYA